MSNVIRLNGRFARAAKLFTSKIILFTFFLTYGCTPAPKIAPAPVSEPVRVVVAEGLAHPWDMVFITSKTALVTEKDGGLKRISLVDGRSHFVSGFLDDLDNIRRDDPRDNSGMFGIALDPKYKQNGWIYIAYSSGDVTGTVVRVIRGKLNADDKLTNIQDIFRASPLSKDRFHYGGGLVFGNDGKLYVTVGERIFTENDQPEIPVAQDPTDARGKIYRLNADGTFPQDNPDFGLNAVKGLFAMGVRNPQGITLDPKTGNIWFSDHGPLQGDEINMLNRQANYGWPIQTMGLYRDENYTPPELNRAFTAPAHYWEQTVAPTGMTFYTGKQFPQWQGHLFVAGLSGGNLWHLNIKDDVVQSAALLFEDDPIRLRNVVQSPDGKLYLLTDEKNGKIIRLDIQ